MELTSGEIKKIKKLKDKKYRKSENLFLAEGKKSCEELLKSNYQIEYTLASTDEYQDYPNFCLIPYEILKQIATTTTPQDVVCVVKIPKLLDDPPTGNSLVLDNVQDPGNVGTLIRSALAFGFTDIYFINCADIFGEKVIRSSMGNIFNIKPHVVDFEYIEQNKKVICDKMIGTNMSSKNLKEIDTNGRITLVVGNEGNGVSQKMLSICDEIATIPMDNGVESLNVGIAGSIAMYEIFNK